MRPAPRRKLLNPRCVQAVMVLCSLLIALLIPALGVRRVEPAAYPMAIPQAGISPLKIRQVSGVTFAMPPGLSMVQHTYTAEELYRGRLLLINDGHPLPAQAPRPDTLTIATYGKGMVPVSDLSLKSGRDTIRALTNLFAQLRGSGAGSFVVWAGTQTPAEQLEQILHQFRSESSRQSLDDAHRSVLNSMDLPGKGELQQEYTVELRMGEGTPSQPDPRPLEETVHGRQLLRLAWRNGFVRTMSDDAKQNAFRFRYVGIGHATAMTYLDVDLPTYLAILHEKRVMTVEGENGQVFLIQCLPATGDRMMFQLPQGADSEVSYDNIGYAIACSCLKEGWKHPVETAVAVKASPQKTPPKQ